MDPVTAMATASAAFGAIKKGFDWQRRVHDVGYWPLDGGLI